MKIVKGVYLRWEWDEYVAWTLIPTVLLTFVSDCEGIYWGVAFKWLRLSVVIDDGY